MLLLALFIGLPLLEFTLLIEVGAELGALNTIAVVVLTGVVGASLARSQGLAILAKVQAETAAGRAPTDTMLEGFMVLLAGLVLLTPGFLTDAFGLLCLFPLTRKPLLLWLRKRIKSGVVSGRMKVHVEGMATGSSPQGFPGQAAQGDGFRRAVGGQAIKDVEVIDDGAHPEP
ncbi:MAG: UPF0716 protein FxsA [Pseudohongiellaceae bacterium]|jgi:UPF0716 protein FxsA